MKKRTELCLLAAQVALDIFEQKVGPVEPPVPVNELATFLGFQVVPLTLVPDEFSALVSIREKLIGINGRHHRHRQRFSICHELAHILLHHPPESRCTPRQILIYNLEADECAAELLMASRLVRHWFHKISNAAELSSIFDVSEEAMKRKLEQLGLLGSSIREPVEEYDA